MKLCVKCSHGEAEHFGLGLGSFCQMCPIENDVWEHVFQGGDMPEEKVSCRHGDDPAVCISCQMLAKRPSKREPPAADAGPRQPTVIDDTFVAAVEDRLGMGHGAWDMIGAEKICRAVLEQAAVPPVPQEAAPCPTCGALGQYHKFVFHHRPSSAPDWAMRVAQEIDEMLGYDNVFVTADEVQKMAARIREAGSERERELEGMLRAAKAMLQISERDHPESIAEFVAEASRLLGGN